MSDRSFSSAGGKRKSPMGAAGGENPKRQRRRKASATRPLGTKRPKGRDSGRETATEEEEEEEEEPEYEIEKIVNCRGEGDWREYLVKWKGWGNDSNQWLSVHEMGKADELVDEYRASALRRIQFRKSPSGTEEKEEENKRKSGIAVWV